MLESFYSATAYISIKMAQQQHREFEDWDPRHADSTRECFNCQLECPEHLVREDPREDPLLMDEEDPALPHWKVCTGKNSQDKIKKARFFHRKNIKEWNKLHLEKPQTQAQAPATQQPTSVNTFKKLERPEPKTKTTEDYLLEKFDENWKIMDERFERLERILESYRNQQIQTNSLIRSIMRHVGIPDT